MHPRAALQKLRYIMRFLRKIAGSRHINKKTLLRTVMSYERPARMIHLPISFNRFGIPSSAAPQVRQRFSLSSYYLFMQYACPTLQKQRGPFEQALHPVATTPISVFHFSPPNGIFRKNSNSTRNFYTLIIIENL